MSESQQLSIAVSTEAQGASGILSIPIEWTATRALERYRRVHRFASGHTYRNLRAPDPRELWEIRGEVSDTTEADGLRAFFDAHRGPEIPFFWTPPEPFDTQITVRFMDQIMFDAPWDSTLIRIRFRVEKCLG